MRSSTTTTTAVAAFAKARGSLHEDGLQESRQLSISHGRLLRLKEVPGVASGIQKNMESYHLLMEKLNNNFGKSQVVQFRMGKLNIFNG